MLTRMTKRFLTEVDTKLLWKFSYNFGWKGMRAVQRFMKRTARGDTFPAFLFLSVTDKCNLNCQGCWVTPANPSRQLSVETLHHIINESKKQGSYFFGILGGEPLLHPQILDVMAAHPDCYFLLFTNGHLIDDTVAARMRQMGNVSPLISIEGNPKVSDIRRGGKGVFDKTLDGLEACRKHRLINGVATSVCKSNIKDLATDAFIQEMVERGVHYLWYYIYRPVGPNPSPELCLSPEEVRSLRQFIVDARKRSPLMIVDAYWDAQGRALCPAAIGMSHHIGPGGEVEPCPPIQFAADRIDADTDIHAILNGSAFLQDFRNLACSTSRGCILMERPDLLEQLMSHSTIVDTTGRNTGLKELTAMTCRASHHHPGQEIPETYWPYRLAKKYWFFGFGAYG